MGCRCRSPRTSKQAAEKQRLIMSFTEPRACDRDVALAPRGRSSVASEGHAVVISVRIRTRL